MSGMRIQRVTVGPQAENCYVLSMPERADCVVIDPGAEPERILAACGDRKIAAILLTHAHGDHIGALERLRAGGVPVYIHARENEALSDPVRNVSAWLGQPMQASPAEHLVEDGDLVEAAGIRLEVLHTPGHTAGSVCYLTDGAIFTGDTVLCGTHGRTDLPTGSQAEMERSLERLTPILMKIPYCGGH